MLCCRCAVMSWSVCVTWAGPEKTVTPRLRSVTSWLDQRPPFQVWTWTLYFSAVTARRRSFFPHLVFVFGWREMFCNHFFFGHYFSLVLCRQAHGFDRENRGQIWVLFFSFLCFCPVFSSMSFFSSFTLVVQFYYYLPKKGTHSSCSTWSHQSRNQRLSIMSFLSLFPLDLRLLLLLMTLCFGSTAVVCGQCFPTCPGLREWDVSHTLSLSLVLCLRYHQYQHHRRGHRRLHSLPRTHPGCYSLVLQVSHCENQWSDYTSCDPIRTDFLSLYL